MHRSLYKSMGYSDYDLDRPLIGIANSWNRVVPGHYNLNQVSKFVKQGIHQAGGTPVEFGVIAACDGIAQGHEGMHFILPTRDLIANDIEMMVEAHRLDAVVMLGSCDKIVPAMLMAAARLDLPAIIVVGGPMEGGCQFDGRSADITSVMEGLGMKEGFDVGLEMSGSAAALTAMLPEMCHGGRIAMLGIQPQGTAIDWDLVVFNGLTIKGIYGREMYETWYQMTSMIQSGLDISPVITHHLPAADFEAGFAAMKSGQSGKVILDWDKI